MKLLAPIAVLLLAAPAAAQLRPLPPADWHAAAHAAACGAGYYRDLAVGLVGDRGTLRSLGDCTVALDVGGVRLRVAGVAHRWFAADTSYAEPFGAVRTDLGPDRSDWGDLVLETVVPVRWSGSPWRAGVRMGARVPISDNRIGLERDRTDIHMLLMGGYAAGRWAAHVEAGVAINGTRIHWREQQDVLAYGVEVGYGLTESLRLRLRALGHVNDRTERGNENQGEVRAGVRWGRGTWLEAEAIAGYTDASPSWGVRVRLGRRFGR